MAQEPLRRKHSLAGPFLRGRFAPGDSLSWALGGASAGTWGRSTWGRSLRSGRPAVEPLGGPFGCALTIDVEEWYHTCLVPSYVRPAERPVLAEELDRVLPEILSLLAETGVTATFFVLGEVAERLPGRVREIAAAGHEVASHGHHHLRASERPADELLVDLRRSRMLLEDVTGRPVLGYRAPEWSLRALASPKVPLVAAAGYRYDSSLAPYPIAGRVTNPCRPVHLRWDHGPELDELPPLALSPLRLPVGSWTGRLLPPEWLIAAARECHARGGLPVVVVHPWELTGRPTPGRLTGLARFVHETGRQGYLPRFRQLLAALPWTTLQAAAGMGSRVLPIVGGTPGRPRAAAHSVGEA